MNDILKPGTRTCLCRGCNQYFTSPTSFDKHRVGSYPDRRCMTEFEMREGQLEPDARRVWRRAEKRALTHELDAA